MNNTEEITSILMVILAVIICILMFLSFIYIVFRSKNKKKKKEEDRLYFDKSNKEDEQREKDKIKEKVYKEYTKESIFKFMDFEKVEDSMIIQKKGKFLMVIECQGINYDLMSDIERVSVERGFIQFLNTLRHPIQLYIQTRTVNLERSIRDYKEKLRIIEENYTKKNFEYREKEKSGVYPKKDLQKKYYELVKDKNLYEYTKDIISDIEKNSLNKNVLNKKYYIVVPQYQSEMEVGDFSKEEIQNMAFSELYTKCKSIIRTLYGCQINGRILDSEGLIDLLYIAYNRDESDIFSAQKAYKAGYEELYSTSQDVFEKKINVLNKEIERRAIELANEKISEVKSDKEKIAEDLEKDLNELIMEMAENIIDENKSYIGNEVAEDAIAKLKEDNQEGGSKNEKKQTKRGRPKVTSE